MNTTSTVGSAETFQRIDRKHKTLARETMSFMKMASILGLPLLLAGLVWI
ncbi:hypothetical protein LNL84_09360 [Vibrio sp. ZSDZ34]|jgi:transposase-like protein|uniref:Uncharacterized protein n=1 Tax=Vibrio gelatinilyticus TaxID=2893468 RepID=A0A9X1WB18_9VIBR|nr:hypothetical protein [Vibrio gelatinilyticus]MCJ2377041.1 hypothetical protein [Vibrio gelatinilyticus]